MGKTVAVACFISVFLICVPGIVISTFSTGKRASGLMMEMTKKILYGNAGVQERVVKENVEELHIGTVPKITSYAASKAALKQNTKQLARNSNVSVFHSYPSNPVQKPIHTTIHTYMHIHISISCVCSHVVMSVVIVLSIGWSVHGYTYIYTHILCFR